MFRLLGPNLFPGGVIHPLPYLGQVVFEVFHGPGSHEPQGMPATAVIREGSGVFGQFQKPVPLVETKPACRNRVIRDFGFQKYGPVQVLPNPVQDMLADLVVALFGVDQ